MTTSAGASERQRILTDNRRLHRSTAGVYDRLHPHMQNTFEQWLQTRDIRHMVEIVRASGATRPNVLDLGCGTGNLTICFLSEGAAVTAVDLSAEMLDVLARKLASSPSWRERCQLLLADVDSFLGEVDTPQFDIVALSSVVHHLPDYIGSLSRLATRIRPGGFLYLVHEPAHRAEMTSTKLVLRRLWSVLPRLANRLLRRRNTDAALSQQWAKEDTTYADYHYHRDGVSVIALTEALAPAGFRLSDSSRYNAHESSIVSWLDNHWFAPFRYEQFQRTYFRAIWRRLGEPARLAESRETGSGH